MKMVIWIVIVLLIVGGIFYLSNNKTDSIAVDTGENSIEIFPEGVMEDGVLTEEEEKMLLENGDQTATESSESKTPSVFYTKDGFSPKEITIKKGESVSFFNQSEGEMWVGSAMHPTHKDYPIKSSEDCLGSSFDQCQSVPNGGSWTFQFDREGEHGYHNHVKAEDWGEVVVE